MVAGHEAVVVLVVRCVMRMECVPVGGDRGECFDVWNAYDRPVSLRNLGRCPPVATHAFLFRFAKPIAHFEFEGEVCAYDVLFVDAHRQVSEETIIRCNHACAQIDTHIHIHTYAHMHTCIHRCANTHIAHTLSPTPKST